MLPNLLATGSLSLGQNALHTLDNKIRIAALHGYAGIEIVYADLKRYSDSRELSMVEGAEAIRKLCAECKIDILSLAPFENYEGHNSPLSHRLTRARHWMDVTRALGAPYLQVPAQYSKDCTGKESIIVSDLQQLADLGTARLPIVSIAYEPMSWSMHVSTWEKTLRIINAVNRTNFGLCLDSFHILTKLWASPYEASGKRSNADAELARSLTRFKNEFPLDKLFYIQLSDGERFDPPFSERHAWHIEGEAAEFTWSKHARPFPGESELGAYLPVGKFLKACVADTQFKGWVSMEIFDRRMRDENFRIQEAAIRGNVSWNKLQRELEATGSKL